MFEAIDLDQLERSEEELIANQREINRLWARQGELVEEMDAQQFAFAAGARNVSDWLCETLDINSSTAHRLRTVAYGGDTPIRRRLRDGEISFDRAYFLTKLAETGLTDPELAELSATHSLGRLYGLWERRRKVEREGSQTSFDDRYLVVQPTLDLSAHKLWGMLVGADGETVARALLQREGEMPALDDETRGQRAADALASICLDSLTGSSTEGRAVTVAEVFVDASLAASTSGEAGATLSSGPKVGPETLSEILCSGKVRVSVPGLNGILYSDLGEAVPPAIRSLVMFRDLGQCTIDGCRSTYRLQIHHIEERSKGGGHHPDNLVTLCWFHHHVAIHGRGMEIDPDSPIHRRRLRWPTHSHDPPAASPLADPKLSHAA
jgi:hypothetical protein